MLLNPSRVPGSLGEYMTSRLVRFHYSIAIGSAGASHRPFIDKLDKLIDVWTRLLRMSRYKVRVLLYQRWYGLWQRHRVFFGASAVRLARRFLLNKSFPVFAMQQAKVQTVISALSVFCCVGGACWTDKVYGPKKTVYAPWFISSENATTQQKTDNAEITVCCSAYCVVAFYYQVHPASEPTISTTLFSYQPRPLPRPRHRGCTVSAPQAARGCGAHGMRRFKHNLCSKTDT